MGNQALWVWYQVPTLAIQQGSNIGWFNGRMYHSWWVVLFKEVGIFDINTTLLKIQPILGKYVDGSSNSEGSGVGIVIISPERAIFEYALCFEFSTINNKAEYEAIIMSLEAAKELEEWDLKVYSDSQLVIGYIKEDNEARRENMVNYLQKVEELIRAFDSFEI